MRTARIWQPAVRKKYNSRQEFSFEDERLLSEYLVEISYFCDIK
jgi:hypothetical protein